MVTIGQDAHLKTSTMTVLNHNGQKIARKRIENDPECLLSFVRQFSGPKRIALESCYNWPVFHELFKDEVDEFHLLHARKLRSIIDSQSKTDGHDSDEIAYLMHSGRPLAHSYVANIETRGFRRLLRGRVTFSLDIARIKNQVHAIINAHTFYSQRPKNFKDLFCRRGLEYIKGLSLPAQERFIINQLLAKKEDLENRRDEFDQYIQGLNFHAKDLRWLETVPGMGGKLFKYIVLAEIDNIERFRHSRALVAYAGLVPKEYSSGEKNRKGHLRTESNTFLRWAMLEAVLPAMLVDKGLKQKYYEVKKRSNSSSARIVIARILMEAIFHVLKEQRAYKKQTAENRE